MKLSVEEAAKIMQVSPQFLRLTLQREGLPFGIAMKFESQWRYYINKIRFEKWMAGEDMKGAANENL